MFFCIEQDDGDDGDGDDDDDDDDDAGGGPFSIRKSKSSKSHHPGVRSI